MQTKARRRCLLVLHEKSTWEHNVYLELKKRFEVTRFALWEQASFQLGKKILGVILRAKHGKNYALLRWEKELLLRKFTAYFVAKKLANDKYDTVYAPVFIPTFIKIYRKEIKPTNIATILDLPLLRMNHKNLDLLSKQYPELQFLLHFRASEAELTMQEAEIAHASECIVFNQKEAEQLRATNSAIVAQHRRLDQLPTGKASVQKESKMYVAYLAGKSRARDGTMIALEVLNRVPNLEMVVQNCEASEPKSFLSHPRVRTSPLVGHEAFAMVLDLSVVPHYDPLLEGALKQGIPVIGLGFGEPAQLSTIDGSTYCNYKNESKETKAVEFIVKSISNLFRINAMYVQSEQNSQEI